MHTSAASQGQGGRVPSLYLSPSMWVPSVGTDDWYGKLVGFIQHVSERFSRCRCASFPSPPLLPPRKTPRRPRRRIGATRVSAPGDTPPLEAPPPPDPGTCATSSAFTAPPRVTAGALRRHPTHLVRPVTRTSSSAQDCLGFGASAAGAKSHRHRSCRRARARRCRSWRGTRGTSPPWW